MTIASLPLCQKLLLFISAAAVRLNRFIFTSSVLARRVQNPSNVRMPQQPSLSENQAQGIVSYLQANFIRVLVNSQPLKALDVGNSATFGVELLCEVKTVVKRSLEWRKKRVLVGDKVLVESIDWVHKRGMIEEVFDRKSEIFYPPVANVDHFLVLFSLDQPKLEPFMFTKFLVEAESTGIPLTVALNKEELVDEGTLSEWKTRLHSWGYEPVLCSVDTNRGLDTLQLSLRGQISVIVGPSGVGKSSLISALRGSHVVSGAAENDNWFEPILGSKWFVEHHLGEVSTRSVRGEHTTQDVSLLPLSGGRYIVDSYGFNQPSLMKVTRQSLAFHFPEVRKMLVDNEPHWCLFRNCLHIGERGCLVKEDWERYSHYLQLLNGIKIGEEFQQRAVRTIRKGDWRSTFLVHLIWHEREMMLEKFRRQGVRDGGSSTLSSNASASSRSNYVASSWSGNSNATIFQGTNSTLNPGLNSGSSGAVQYEALPSLRDTPNAEKQNMFIKKLNLCCVVFDFTEPAKNLKEKDIKRQTLMELVDHVTSPSGKFTETVMQEIMKMVSINLSHRLSAQLPIMDPARPHLQLVYEFLLRFVASPETDAELARRYVDCSFLLMLFDLFDSEDPREREYLKMVVLGIYWKFVVHRHLIWDSILCIFYTSEKVKHNGIAQVLDILSSTLNEHALLFGMNLKSVLGLNLMPLHKPKCISMYHRQLSYCMTQFVVEDCKLAETAILGLLKYWPITNSSKEVMFLDELEEVLGVTQPSEFQLCMVPLFWQIDRCLSSSHFQVAERALFLWNNDHIENLIKQNRQVILPIIFPSLEKNSRSHWNQGVQRLTINVRKFFSVVDPELFQECLLRFLEED